MRWNRTKKNIKDTTSYSYNNKKKMKPKKTPPQKKPNKPHKNE